MGLVGGVFFASRYAMEFGTYVATHLLPGTGEGVISLVGFASLFLLIWIGMLLVGMIVSRLVTLSGFGVIDRLAGAAVGSAKIFLIFAVAAYGIGSVGFLSKTKDESLMFPLLFNTGAYLFKLDEVQETTAATGEVTDKAKAALGEVRDKGVETGKTLGAEAQRRINESIEQDLKQTLDTLPKMEEFKGILRRNNLKFTQQREAILEAVYGFKGHFSPEDLYQTVQDENGGLNIGIATVYRTLALLEKEGLVTSLSFGVSGKKYEYGKKAHHDHMICERCGKIIEFVDEEIEARQAKIARDHGFTITDHAMQIHGICKECNSK